LLTSNPNWLACWRSDRGCGGRFFGQGGVLVRHLIELADKLVDFADAPHLLGDLLGDGEIRPETFSTELVTSAVVWPARPTCCAPDATLVGSVDEVADLLAAAALRLARLRTSLATTAKPRPCSPARAASTAALSARMLV
jgi:hypothetical protein